jgi:RHS repeat-associated protein
VSIAPGSGTFNTGSQSVTIDWCGHANLAAATRQIVLNGTNVTASFSYSTSIQTGCSSHASSTGTVTLAIGSNTLTASINDALGQNGSAEATYTLQAPTGGPVLSLAPHNATNRNVALCLADCFDAVASYSTPAYRSMDQDRSLTVTYRSGQAAPVATVTVDARDTNTTLTASTLSLKILDGSNQPVMMRTGRTETFFTNQQNAWVRLAGQFDASGLATGAYAYTAVVTSHFTDNSSRATSVPVRVLVVNERGSPYGAGWTVAGLERVYPQSDGSMVVTDGTGTVEYFGPCASPGCYTSPPGDFSVLSGGGASWTRRYPDGTTVTYSGTGYATSVQDRFGSTTSFTYDGSMRLSSVTDPAGRVITVTPSASPYGGTALSIVDPAGRTSVVHTDGNANVVDIVDPAGGHPFQSPTYDPSSHRLTNRYDRRSGQWSYGYDCSGHVATSSAPTVTIAGASTRPQTQLTHIDVPGTACATGLGASAASPAPLLLTANVRASITNPRGYATTYAVDVFLAPTLVRDALSRTTVISRDQASHVTNVKLPSGQAVSSTWTGPNLTQTTDSAAGRTITYTYDTRYNVPTSVSGNATSVQYFLNPSGTRPDSTRVGATGAPTVYKYDARGRDTLVVDPMGHATHTQFAADQWNNTGSILLPGGRQTTFASDGAGRQRKVVNALGDSVVSVFDVLSRIQRQVGARGDVTQFTYDSLFLTKVTDAANQAYQYSRNALGWVETLTDPTLATETFQYDADGNVTSATNRRHQTVTTSYDALDRPTQVTSDGAPAPTVYSYDPTDLWTTVANGESTDTLRYDAAGRVTSEVTYRGTLGLKVTSTYKGPQGERDYVAWGNANLSGVHPTRYWYNTAGQLTTITPDGYASGAPINIDLGYDAERLASTAAIESTGLTASLTNSTTHDRTLTSYGPTTVPTAAAISQAFQLAVHVDSLERVSERYRGNSTSDTTQVYWYDPAGQLNQVLDRVLGNRSCTRDAEKNYVCTYASETWVRNQSFTYDLVGNRSDLGAVITTGNRLTSFNGYTLRYDADGNLVRKSKPGVADDSLVWNSLGQLEKVNRSGTWVSFGYDGLGRRVRKTVGTQTTYYLWDGQALLAELDGAGNERVEYAYYPGGMLATVSVPGPTGTGVPYYAVTETNGSVLGLFKLADDGIDAQYRYEPFGSAALTQGTVPNSLRWHGLLFDDETGLYYARARYYDPELARFVSEDPIGLGGGVNQYIYAANDPMNSADPSGLMPCQAGALAQGWQSVQVDGHWWCTMTGGPVLPTITVYGDPSPFSSNFGNPCARGGACGSMAEAFSRGLQDRGIGYAINGPRCTMDCSTFVYQLQLAQGCNAPHVSTGTIGQSPGYTQISSLDAGPGDLIVQPGSPYGHMGQIEGVDGNGDWKVVDWGNRMNRNPRTYSYWGPGTSARNWFPGHLSSFKYYRPHC